MRILKEQFRCSLIGAIMCIVVTTYCVCTSTWLATALFGVGAFALIILASRVSENYQAAKLIAENPILTVDVASITEAGDCEAAESSVNLIVSGFGILMGKKPYKFGHGGVNLIATEIDRKYITLSFGNEDKTYCVRLLHGIADQADVDAFSERLKYETGVTAEIIG